MKVKVLNESYQGWELAHWTNLNGLIGILSSDELKGNAENRLFLAGKTTVSFSRVKGKPRFVDYPGWCKIIVDAGKLEQNYQLTPFEYWTNPVQARSKDPDDFKSERSQNKSEFEISLVLSDTIQTAILTLPDVKRPAGTVTINLNKKEFVSVKDRAGNEITPDEEGFYQFKKVKEIAKKRFKLKLVQAEYMDLFGDGHSYIYNLEINFEDGETVTITNDTFQSEEVRSVTNFSKYIKRVEFPDFVVQNGKLINRDDIVVAVTSNVGEAYVTPAQYFSEILQDGHTAGFNKTKQRLINHKLKTWQKFIKEMNSVLNGKIGKYKTDSDWIADNDVDYATYEKNYIESYYITDETNVKDNPVFCIEYKEQGQKKPSYALLSATNRLMAEKVILPKFLKRNGHIIDAYIVEYKKKYFKDLTVSKKLLTQEGSIDSLYQLIKDNGDNELTDMDILLIVSNGNSAKLKDCCTYSFDDRGFSFNRNRRKYVTRRGGITIKMR